MFNYVWPMMLVIFSNVAYQICTKSVPNKVNPFASLTVTYITSAIVSVIMYYSLSKQGNIIREFAKMNIHPLVFGIVIVGLEVGWIYAYKAGWQIGTASIIQSSFLAAILLFVGLFFYKEVLTRNKIVGVIICMVGLAFVNIK